MKIKDLIGKRILNIRAMTLEEIDEQGWDTGAVVLEIDGDIAIIAMQDEEGNGAGELIVFKGDDSHLLTVDRHNDVKLC